MLKVLWSGFSPVWVTQWLIWFSSHDSVVPDEPWSVFKLRNYDASKTLVLHTADPESIFLHLFFLSFLLIFLPPFVQLFRKFDCVKIWCIWLELNRSCEGQSIELLFKLMLIIQWTKNEIKTSNENVLPENFQLAKSTEKNETKKKN